MKYLFIWFIITNALKIFEIKIARTGKEFRWIKKKWITRWPTIPFINYKSVFNDMALKNMRKWKKEITGNQLFIFTQTILTLIPKQAPIFTHLQYRSFENTVGKGKIARSKQFLLFSQSRYSTFFHHFHSNLKFSSASSLNLKESEICGLGKG